MGSYRAHICNLAHDMGADRIRFYQGEHYPYMHRAAFLNRCSPLAYGDNSDRELYSGCNYGYHAETAAIKKLPFRSRSSSLLSVDLVVIRVNRKGYFRNSKPCTNCLSHLARLDSYKIRYVFYTNKDGSITRIKFSHLLSGADGHVTTRFR